MGIYPERTTRPANTTYAKEWVERLEYTGYAVERSVTAGEWVEIERTDCFCCSCRENGYGGLVADPYCRNHGWYGERPCETHMLPGTAGDDGIMPVSVQARNTELREGAKR